MKSETVTARSIHQRQTFERQVFRKFLSSKTGFEFIIDYNNKKAAQTSRHPSSTREQHVRLNCPLT